LDLKGRHFLRIHRSFLIGTDHIAAFTNNEIELKGIIAPLPIGASYKAQALEFMQDYMK
jgi:DNA-binding LytR/AlgR family response regulator